MKSVKFLVISALSLALTGCMSDSQFKERLSKTLKENPEILGDAIKEKPADFIEAFQEAVKKAQTEMASKREEEEKKALEETFNNPLKPNIRADESFLGPKDAPIVLVEYSDFECPFCSRGFQTVEALKKRYAGKIKFIFKHLPLSFHKHAMPAAQYFEAIRLQNGDKAFKFHDIIFSNQDKLKGGDKYLASVAKGLGVDMNKLKAALESDAVKNRIAEDIAEAQKFGIEGTPGFVINGIPVKGAYPEDHFVGIINKLTEQGKLKL